MKSIIFLLLFFTNFAYSQSGDSFEDESKLTNTEKQTAKELFLKMIDSEVFKSKDEVLDKLFPMLNKEHDDLISFSGQKEEIGEDKIQKWANKNFETKNVEQATKLLTKLVDLWKQIAKDNIALDQILKKANLDEFQEIQKPYLERRFSSK